MAPAELENLVRSLNGVADCAVLGIPHPRAGQVWLLNEHCKHRLFQVPRAVVVKGRENLTVDEVFLRHGYIFKNTFTEKRRAKLL